MPALGAQGRTLFDISGRGNNGTLTNMDPATDWRPNQFGMALNFNPSSNNFVNLGNPTNLRPIQGVTIFSVITPGANQGGNWGRIISKSNGGSGDNWGLSVQDHDLRMSFRINNNSVTATNPLVAGRLHKVASTYDGAIKRIYQDGLENGSETQTGLISTANDVTIGRNATSTNRYYQGGINLILVFDGALFTKQIGILTLDPLAPFRLRQSMPFFVTAVPGGGFQPAWAAQSTHLGGVLVA